MNIHVSETSDGVTMNVITNGPLLEIQLYVNSRKGNQFVSLTPDQLVSIVEMAEYVKVRATREREK